MQVTLLSHKILISGSMFFHLFAEARLLGR
jgi:hypothetical protein